MGHSHLDLPIPAPLNPPGIPLLLNLSPQLILPLTPFPSWLEEPPLSLITLELHLPFPQGNNIVVTLHWLNKVGAGLTDEVLLEWALDMLHSPEDWRWLWSPEPATTPSSSPTLLNCQLSPPSYVASNANPWTMYTPNALNISAPSIEGLPLDILNTPVPCTHALSAENSVMWAPVAQLQLWHVALLSLPEWATLADFESVPQDYEGGNVMVEEPPTSFSPFSLTDCTLLSHFSFNDFIIVAFLDLARDLDFQI